MTLFGLLSRDAAASRFANVTQLCFKSDRMLLHCKGQLSDKASIGSDVHKLNSSSASNGFVTLSSEKT